MSVSSKDKKFPEGIEYLDLHERAMTLSRNTLSEFTNSNDDHLKQNIQRFGTLVSLIYRAGTCYWGCRGGDHQMEWLAGKVLNSAHGSFRLLQGAYYDESLVLSRGIGEIANLLWLFMVDRASYSGWIPASRAERMTKFSPVAVRKKLEAAMPFVPIDHLRYQRLCEIGSHPTPGIPPGHYNKIGRPILGAIMQPIGATVALHELGYATAMAALPIAKLLGLSSDKYEKIKIASIELGDGIGEISILNYTDFLKNEK